MKNRVSWRVSAIVNDVLNFSEICCTQTKLADMIPGFPASDRPRNPSFMYLVLELSMTFFSYFFNFLGSLSHNDYRLG